MSQDEDDTPLGTPSPSELTRTAADVLVSEEEEAPLSVPELLKLPAFRAVLVASGALGFLGSCFNNVFVLMAYTPLDQGGLALSVRVPSQTSVYVLPLPPKH